MTIKLSRKDYLWNKAEIESCLRGEMCKIMKCVTKLTNPIRPDEIHYAICSDVTCGGWHTPYGSDTGRAFHGYDKDGSTTITGLGTFFLIDVKETEDGGCILELTDDLNPELP